MMLWTIIFLGGVVADSAVQWWLDRRQAASVISHRDHVPERFAAVIDLAAHQKAADYTLAKLAHGRYEQWWSVVLLLLWTLGGGLNTLDEWVRQWQLSPLISGTVTILLFFSLAGLLTMPLDAWKTFVLEARFGFNKSTPGLFLADQFRQWLLLLVIGTPLILLLLWLMAQAGSWWWLYGWAVWTGFSLLMMWAFPNWIAPLFNRFEPLPEGEERQRIEALLERCGFTCDGLFVMDGSRRSAHGNAYFTGFGNNKRIVFFDTLLEKLTLEEMEAVLAHELGHFHHGHVRQRMIAMSVFSLLGFALLGWLAGQSWFYQGLGVDHASDAMALLLFILVLPVLTFWLPPLSHHFSRRHEFEADRYAVRHSSANVLMDALVKLYRDNAATLTPDPWYSAWHDSHPPAPVRIAALTE